MEWFEKQILMISVNPGGGGSSGGSEPPKKNILELDVIPPDKLQDVSHVTEELPCDEPVSRTFKAPQCQRIHKIYATTSDGKGYQEIPVTNQYEMTVTFPDMKFPRNIRVIYTNDSVAITVRTGIGGTTDKNGTTKICRGKDFEYTITPQAGYEIDFVTNNNRAMGGWNPEGGTITLTNIQNPMNIEVAFKKKSYSVTVNTGTGGSASPSSGVVGHGENFSFTITPSVGFRVSAVTSNGQNVSFSQSGGTVTIPNITENKNISVQFERSTVSVTISRVGSGNVSPIGTQQAQIGSNFTISASATSGSALAQVLVNGENRSFSSATGANTITLSNVSANMTVQIRFITIRQSFGFITYPSSLVMLPAAFRNDGLQIWDSFRSGDATGFQNQGFGVNNRVTRIQFWDGTSVNGLSLRSDYSSARSDFRDKMATSTSNQYHRVRVSRADGGYFDANGRAERNSGPAGWRNINTRSVRVYLSNVSNGNLVFTVSSGMTDGSGRLNTASGVSLNMTVNGQALTVQNRFGTQTVNYSNLGAGTYSIRIEMRVSGESDLFYCEGRYVIL